MTTMESQGPVKGTVMPLASLFPAEEARKASERVLDKLREHDKQLDQLQEFITDNNRLINLIQRLPDQLHHDIMVPFGKAAFFPGRLIHTNEFMVLLGEGYFAERSSKQTIEILKRRGDALESQVDSLKAVMDDLRAEASFFGATASEAAEGLVEIREDYIEETSPREASLVGLPKPDIPSSRQANNDQGVVEDDEYNRILARLAELEKEEEEAKNSDGSDEDDKCHVDYRVNEHSAGQFSASSEAGAPKIQPVMEVKSSQRLPAVNNNSSFSEKALKHHEVKENVQTSAPAETMGSFGKSAPAAQTSKAFTGSIVERAHTTATNLGEQDAGRSAKPVSRFKLQRK